MLFHCYNDSIYERVDRMKIYYSFHYPLKWHILPEFTSSFYWGLCYSIISFMCVFWMIVVCPFSFDHCVVLLVLRFWFPLWYLQTLLKLKKKKKKLCCSQYIYWLYKGVRISLCFLPVIYILSLGNLHPM